jgi:hypothetical protein
MPMERDRYPAKSAFGDDATEGGFYNDGEISATGRPRAGHASRPVYIEEPPEQLSLLDYQPTAEQLSLLDYQPTAEEMQPPATEVKPIAPSPHAIAFLESQAAYYLQLIQRFTDGRKCSKEVRFNEMERLAAMRQAALEQIKTLENSGDRDDSN